MSVINAEFSTALAAVIKKHREAKRLSLSQLAKLSGVSQTYPGMIEKCQYTPTVDVAHAISRALGVPFSKLVAEAERLNKKS